MKIRDRDTIAAIATPPGTGAIAVVRLSGPGAIEVADRAFRGARRLKDVPGYSVHHGTLVDPGDRDVDEVLATVFRAPHSYTGEDAVEFSCHGGVMVTRRVLEALLGSGARQADPGEFTRRAFINGRIDLSQAEAVADLIAARSASAHATSLAQLRGKLAGRVKEIRAGLLSLCALLEIDLDFAEEGIDIIPRPDVEKRIGEVGASLRSMIESFAVGRVYRDGVAVALAGNPNAGKSSIFNALLQENRTIVTPIPGTTRDSVEECVSVDGVLLRLTDTAGLRETSDIIESEGVERSRRAIESADTILLVVDATACLERRAALSSLKAPHPGQRIVIAFNKIDLLNGRKEGRGERFTFEGIKGEEVYVSAKTGEGLGVLQSSLISSATDAGERVETDCFVTSRRHWEALSRAAKAIQSASSALDKGATNEFLAFDVREAVNALSEITGEISSDDVLNEVFKNFCIGK